MFKLLNLQFWFKGCFNQNPTLMIVGRWRFWGCRCRYAASFSCMLLSKEDRRRCRTMNPFRLWSLAGWDVFRSCNTWGLQGFLWCRWYYWRRSCRKSTVNGIELCLKSIESPLKTQPIKIPSVGERFKGEWLNTSTGGAADGNPYLLPLEPRGEIGIGGMEGTGCHTEERTIKKH